MISHLTFLTLIYYILIANNVINGNVIKDNNVDNANILAPYVSFNFILETISITETAAGHALHIVIAIVAVLAPSNNPTTPVIFTKSNNIIGNTINLMILTKYILISLIVSFTSTLAKNTPIIIIDNGVFKFAT